jgi:hypothetical protein
MFAGKTGRRPGCGLIDRNTPAMDAIERMRRPGSLPLLVAPRFQRIELVNAA